MSRAADLRKALYGDRSAGILAAAPPPPEPEPPPPEPETAPAKKKPGRPRKGAL